MCAAEGARSSGRTGNFAEIGRGRRVRLARPGEERLAHFLARIELKGRFLAGFKDDFDGVVIKREQPNVVRVERVKSIRHGLNPRVTSAALVASIQPVINLVGAANFREQLEGRNSSSEISQVPFLDDKRVRAAVKSLLEELVLARTGKDQNGNVRVLRMIANPPEESHAAAVRIGEIENDKRRKWIALPIGVNANPAQVENRFVSVTSYFQRVTNVCFAEGLFQEID